MSPHRCPVHQLLIEQVKAAQTNGSAGEYPVSFVLAHTACCQNHLKTTTAPLTPAPAVTKTTMSPLRNCSPR